MTKGFIRAALFGTLATVLSATASMAYDQHVTIHNQSSYDVYEFYASNTNSNAWGRDRLGSGILPAGHQITLNITDSSGSCYFDFRSVFEDGDEVTKMDQDVCWLTDYYITD
jgi:hypothetical protein